VKKVRLIENPVDQKKRNDVENSNTFVFCEKITGMTQFRTESGGDQNITVERVAGLLAMQCLVRGHDPDDFVVLVPAEKNLVGRFLSRAKQLLDEGRAVSRPESLSPRQAEILVSVLRNRANKEIASKLNITVRTVKFHISSLLNKFGVDNRAELARRAAGFMKPDAIDNEGLAFRAPVESSERSSPTPIALDRNLAVSIKSRGMRYPGRQLSA
jgi:DNA-binding CsgD family transcriptional regulator